MTEKRLKVFSEFLYRYQGQFLIRLSKAIEPALMALVNGTLSASSTFPIETVGNQVLERIPKGYIFEYLV
jgi:hypothetical protein